MDDDQFFEAYSQGRVARRADAWTEENWEQVKPRWSFACVCGCLGTCTTEPYTVAANGTNAHVHDQTTHVYRGD